VARIALGHRRTGLCPTFSQPTLQRDGYLLRVPLVGGLLNLSQLECLAELARQTSNGIVELTNRGNLQVRGLTADSLPTALEACRAVGLGNADASLVTISLFAGAAEHELRSSVAHGLADLDMQRLSRKFVVHVDDAMGTTADRSADLSLRLVNRSYEMTIRALGTTTCETEAEAAVLARRLAELCIQEGPHARAADLAATAGPAALAAALRATDAWQTGPTRRRQQTPCVGIKIQPDGTHTAVAAARFGRVNAATLRAISHLLRRHQLATMCVTPWRSFAFACTSLPEAADVLAEGAAIGLLTAPDDPAVGVIACIGAHGCWQTQLDTLAEAGRFIAHRPAGLQPGALVHVSGCDKFCATRAPVTLTLLGRTDQKGFDVLWPQAE
jgi:sulfite reductase beta subunit-like hemoprotein